MNPTDQINALLGRVQALENAMLGLSTVRSFPIEVQNSLVERLADTFISTPAGTGTATTQSVLVSSTPSSITVPAQPSGTLQVAYKGTTYELLYK